MDVRVLHFFCFVCQISRIHEEPRHEENADAEQDDCEVRKHRWVDRTDISRHRLQVGTLQNRQAQFEYFSDSGQICFAVPSVSLLFQAYHAVHIFSLLSCG